MEQKEECSGATGTENRILASAEHEFMTKGFAGARTTAIAEAAGVTHAMLHYYFRTKEKLFERIISEKIDLLKSVLISSFESSGGSIEDTIRSIIERHLDFIAANPDLPRFIISEISANPGRATLITDKIRSYAPFMLDSLQKKLDRAASENNYRHIEARTLILDIVSLNLFSFMAAPIINAVLNNCMADTDTFISQRKKENFDTIMRKLKP